MTDIVERLRKNQLHVPGNLISVAADEIERLREALQEIANIKISPDDGVNKYIVFSVRTTARVAIGEKNYE